MRTLLNIGVSCVLGVLLAVIAVHVLTRNYHWREELEFLSPEELNRRTNVKKENPDAKVEVPESLYDFGIMDKGDKGQHTFTVRNSGTVVLTLEKNATTCTCTDIVIEPKRVAPGGTARITLHWNADRAMGKYKQGGTVLTNDPENPEIAFNIQGLFVSSIIPSPSTLVLPGISTKVTKTSTVRLYGFEKQPLVVTEIEWPDKEHYDIRIPPSALDEKDLQNDLYKSATSVVDAVITVKPGLPLGAFQHKFLFHTNYTREPRFDYSIHGLIFGDDISIGGPLYVRDTGMLLLGKTTQGRGIVRDFSVTFTGVAAEEADLKFKEVSPAWLKVVVSTPRDGGTDGSRRRFYTVSMEIPPDAPISNYTEIEGPHGAALILDTGLQNIPTVRIPIQMAVAQL